MLAAKKKRSQEDTKAKLLSAALDVFSKSGYDAATTRSIAKKAGVNESLIHRYFTSKHGLFMELKKKFRENTLAQFLSETSCENLEDELKRFFAARLQNTARDKKFFRLSISRGILDSKFREDVSKYAQMTPSTLVERFESFVRKGKMRGDLDIPNMIVVLHLLAFSFVFMVDAIECIPREEADKIIRAAASVLVEGLKPRS